MAKTDTKTKLIEVGLAHLLERGLAASGLKLIVDSAQVPKGSFYHYFPQGKDEFVLAVIEEYNRRAQLGRARTLGAEGGSPLAHLEAHFRELSSDFKAQGYRHGCLLGNLAGEAAELSAPLRGALHDGFEAWIQDVAQTLERARELGELRAPGSSLSLARLMIAGWEGAALLMKSEQAPQALDEFHALWFEQVLANPRS